MLTWFFAIVYFRIFFFFLDLIFRNTLSIIADFLAVVCLIVAFFVSVGLAEYTVKKIKDKYSK